MDLLDVVTAIAGGLIGGSAGGSAGGLALPWYLRRRRRRREAHEQAAYRARLLDMQRRAEAMVAEHRANGERGLVLVDPTQGTVIWMGTSDQPIIGPEGRA